MLGQDVYACVTRSKNNKQETDRVCGALRIQNTRRDRTRGAPVDIALARQLKKWEAKGHGETHGGEKKACERRALLRSSETGGADG